MVHYRRNFVPGGTYFFTVALQDRRSCILTERIEELRIAVRAVQASRPFTIEAMVVLPEHLHAIWTLPSGDSDYSGRWRAVKSGFLRNLRKAGISVPRSHRGEALIWQRRFWEHTIRDDLGYERHIAYIHFNPVKNGLVARATDWEYSSFHRFVARGHLPRDWASPPDEDNLPSMGEPS